MIVTIGSIEPTQEPLVELRCPGGRGPHFKETPNLEFYFHETRFEANAVRLFDIQSIFPLHTGKMNVKIKLDRLIVSLEKVVGRRTGGQVHGINSIYYASSEGKSGFAKEHRENSAPAIGDEDSLLEIEREIEGVFINRIKPDVEKQIRSIISAAVQKFLRRELYRF